MDYLWLTEEDKSAMEKGVPFTIFAYDGGYLRGLNIDCVCGHEIMAMAGEHSSGIEDAIRCARCRRAYAVTARLIDNGIEPLSTPKVAEVHG